jgi:hypothetical protein
MRALISLTVMVLATGCYGEAEWVIAPSQGGTETPGTIEGPAPVRLSTFQSITAGLPPAAAPHASAHFDGALYLAATDGLYALDSGSVTWRTVSLGLTSAEKVTSVTRVDTSLLVTVADAAAGKGGAYRLDFGADSFVKLSNAPDAPAWTLARKGSTLLLATTGGLFVSSDRGASWARKSAALTAPFMQPVKGVWASSAAQRIFAVAADGTLHHSDDDGATWATGLVKGRVTALAAGASYVLATSDTEGTLRSDNYGATFRAAPMDVTAQAFAIVNARAFAGTANGVRVSDDGGGTWRDASEGLPPGTSVKTLFAAGPALIAGSADQVYVAAVE